MNEIVYLNHCKPELTELGRTLAESKVLSSEFYTLNKRPTACKVTINKTIVVDGVYVNRVNGDSICLYKDFHIIKLGFTTDNCLKTKQPWDGLV